MACVCNQVRLFIFSHYHPAVLSRPKNGSARARVQDRWSFSVGPCAAVMKPYTPVYAEHWQALCACPGLRPATTSGRTAGLSSGRMLAGTQGNADASRDNRVGHPGMAATGQYSSARFEGASHRSVGSFDQMIRPFASSTTAARGWNQFHRIEPHPSRCRLVG